MDTSVTPLRGPGEFGVVTAIDDTQVVLRLTGELDCGTAPLLRDALDDLRGRRFPRLVFEMSELDFIDSSGLHELVVALKRQRELGGEIVLQEPSAQTMRVLEIVGLAPMFTID